MWVRVAKWTAVGVLVVLLLAVIVPQFLPSRCISINIPFRVSVFSICVRPSYSLNSGSYRHFWVHRVSATETLPSECRRRSWLQIGRLEFIFNDMRRIRHNSVYEDGDLILDTKTRTWYAPPAPHDLSLIPEDKYTIKVGQKQNPVP